MRNVFHTVYIQKPINKLAGRGIAGRERKRHLEEEVESESEPTCKLPKNPSQKKAISLSLFPKLAYFRAQYSNAFEEYAMLLGYCLFRVKVVARDYVLPPM